jgi:hypothetical protein
MSDKITTSKVREIGKELESAFYSACQNRTDFQLAELNVKSHETPERQYKQCLDELVRKVAEIGRIEIEVEALNDEMVEAATLFEKLGNTFAGRRADRERRTKYLHLWQTQIALEGQLREFCALYRIFQASPKFSAAELQSAEAEYYRKRMFKKAAIQLEANGRVDPDVVNVMTLCGIVPDDYETGFSKFLAGAVNKKELAE